VTNGRKPLWRWVELPRYATFCQAVCDQLGIPYEGAFDIIRWAIEETLCWEPHRVSHPDPRFEDERWRYFHTRDAPAHTPLPPLVLTFRVVRFPEMGELGVIEGREVWVEEDLRRIGFSMGA
jgi:hypothetical protein